MRRSRRSGDMNKGQRHGEAQPRGSGCGLMGSGIAQVSAQAGFPTTVVEANQELLDKGLGSIRKNLDALVAKARMDEAGKKEILGRLRGATNFAHPKAGDLVGQAI